MPRTQLIALVVLLLTPVFLAADWPQFRGPRGGQAITNEPLPTDITPDKHVVWKTSLPPGHASPVIIGNKIFLTAVRDKEHLETLCLDRASGKILWRAHAPHKTLEKIHGIGSYAQPSAVADDERVVVLFGSSGLYCYDHDGKQLWHQPMGPFNDEFGAAASPLMEDDRVIIAQDHDTGSFLAAFDKRTGQQIWLTDRSEFSRGYSTPVIWQVNGQKQIVALGMLRVAGYDWNTGRELWTVRGLSRVTCMTPTIGDDNMLYVAAWTAGAEPGDRIRMEPFADFVAQYDESKNGLLEKEEVGSSAALKTRFLMCDRNKDGHIDKPEYDEFEMLFEKSQNAVLAIKPGAVGDATDTSVLWRYEKFIPFVSSPLFYDGRIYMVKDGGILTCLDGKSGKAHKSGRVMGTGAYYASPVAGDGKIYLLSQRGTLSVVSAADQWEVIHSAEFGEETYATPAILDGRIYLRTSGHLYCFGQKPTAGN
jgi:outer membrane protein assembly factor BamB